MRMALYYDNERRDEDGLYYDNERTIGSGLMVGSVIS